MLPWVVADAAPAADPAPANRAGNLAFNPTFDLGPGPDLRPRGWQPGEEFSRGTYELVPPTDSGERCGLCIKGSTTVGGGYANGGWCSQPFAVVPGVIYRLTARIDSGEWPSTSYPTIAWFGADGKWIANTRNGAVVSSAGAWYSVAVAETAPPKAVRARLYFRSDANAGTAYCSEVRLEALAGPTVEYAFTNGDLNQPEPRTWERAGAAALWESGLLGFGAGPGTSTWTSPRIGTARATACELSLLATVDTSQARAGSLVACWLWEGGAADGARSDPVAVPLGRGPTELPIPVPPQDASFGRLVLTATDLDGPVRLSNLRLSVRGTAAAGNVAVATATALAYEGGDPSPDMAEERFLSVFPEPAERQRLAGLLAKSSAEALASAEPGQLALFRAECLYHTGDYTAALAAASTAEEQLLGNDPRHDVAVHYAFFAKQRAREAEQARSVAQLDRSAAQLSAPDKLLTVAKGYEAAGAPGQAALVYDKIAAQGPSRVFELASLQSGQCYHLAQRDEVAVERLRGFIETLGWTRWAPEARLSLAEALLALARYDECITALEPLASDPAYADGADRVTRLCYRRQSADPAKVAEYEQRYGTALPALAYLGKDGTTRGDWMGAYGEEAFVLCAMEAPQDIVGGRRSPFVAFGDGPLDRYGRSVAWADTADELRLSRASGDPADYVRTFLAAHGDENARTLQNPMWGVRTPARWDDRGALHPFDDKGPDLCISVDVPAGAWVVSLYFVDWDADAPLPTRLPVTVTDRESKSSAEFLVSDFPDGVYHSVAVRGPTTVDVRIRKGRSVRASVSGLFLDPIAAPSDAASPDRAKLAPDTSGALDLVTADPLRFATFHTPAEPDPAASPEELLARWALSQVLPGPRDRALALARALVQAALREEGREAGLQRGWAVLDALLAQGRLRQAETLHAALQEVDAQPARLLAMARALRVKQYFRARDLVTQYADGAVARGDGAGLLREGLDWFDLAEKDRQEARNLRRTTFLLSEILLRHAEELLGAEGLRESGLLALAVGCQRSNWFDVGWDESAAELERFLTRYPDSANAPQALRLLATSLSVVSQKEPAGQASQALARLRAYASAQLAQSAEPDLVAETYEVLIGALARRSETDEARSCLEEVTAAFGAESKQARRFDDLRARLRAPSGH